MSAATETATFAAGCFWGVEVEFRNTPGVTDAKVGYIGGQTENPTYKDVCSGRTGHAEGVEVTFDPSEISYGELVDKFWSLHDPTQVNRQGWDVGTQYRSAIFTHSPEQAEAAAESKARAQARFSKPIATEVVPAVTFWPAEEYHQQYLVKNGRATCRIYGAHSAGAAAGSGASGCVSRQAVKTAKPTQSRSNRPKTWSRSSRKNVNMSLGEEADADSGRVACSWTSNAKPRYLPSRMPASDETTAITCRRRALRAPGGEHDRGARRCSRCPRPRCRPRSR